jgi:hypothetical protein
MRRKIAMGVLALALPVGTVLATQTAASAHKVTGSGSTQCHIGGTISFNPPLTSAGSTSIKKEVTTVNASLSSCTGGTPPGPNTTAKIKPVKIKTVKGTAGGTCASFASNAKTTDLKVTVKWAGEKPSKFDVNGLNADFNIEGEAGFAGSFSVSGSYAGSGTVQAYLTPSSTSAIVACTGSVSSLQLDSSTGTVTV